jgi:hypothetical protein
LILPSRRRTDPGWPFGSSQTKRVTHPVFSYRIGRAIQLMRMGLFRAAICPFPRGKGLVTHRMGFATTGKEVGVS